MSNFSESLKLQRKELNMTMQEVADLACISKSMICKIERDEVQPTLDVACRIARAVNKTLSEMLHAPQPTTIIHLPLQEQTLWEDVNHIKRRNVSPVFEGSKFEWLQFELPAFTAMTKYKTPKMFTVEKCVLVTDGVLHIHMDASEYILKPGDSLYFDAGVCHQFCNQDDKLVKFYVSILYL